MRKGWEYKRWKEVLTIMNGKNQSAVVDENGEYPIYGSGGIMGYANNWLCPENCVIIGRKGNINKPIFVETKFWNVDTAFGLNANKEYLLPKFLYYFCLDYNFERHNKAVTIPSLTKADLLKIDIPLPPKSTQLAIVSELDKINELIRLKKEQLKDFDNLAQSLFYEMFGDPVENEKGWEVKKLGKVCSIGTGSTPNRKNKDFYENGTYPWVKSTEVCNLPIYSVEEYITEEALKNSNCTLYPQNTILMAMYGQGKTRGQIGLLKIEACTNQAVAAIIPAKEVVDEIFLCQHLMLMYEHIRNMARGGNQANLNLSIVKSIQIFLPPLSLQHLFAQRIEQIEREKSEVQKSIQDLETLLASRMQYWFE